MTFPSYPKYQEAGVEWLGDVPEHWRSVPIKYMALERNSLFLDGDWIESKDISSEGIRYITTGNVGEGTYKEQGAGFISEETFHSLGCTEVHEGDVLISRLNNPIGRACIAPHLGGRVVTSVDNVIFRPDSRFHKKFIVYLFSSEEYFKHTGNLARGATMQRISRGLLGNIRVVVPSFEEQTQIARFLDHEIARIDRLIDEQQRLIELLKEKRQAVISHAVTKGLNPSVPMKDSGVEWLGEVPVHWDVKRIRYLLKANGLIRGPFGGDLKKEIFVKSGIKVYEQKNAIYQNFRLGDSFITQEKFSEMRRFEVKAGDYIMSCSGTIGRTYRIPEGAPAGIINQALLVIRFSEELAINFTDWIFVADFFENQILDNSQGGAMKNLVGMDIFTSISMPIPPIQEQLSIAQYLMGEIDSFDALINTANQAVNIMQERRSALISAAVTGKIDVRGWLPPASAPTQELEREAV